VSKFDQAYHSSLVVNWNKTSEVNHFHKFLGHPRPEVVKKSANVYKLRDMERCMACNLANARQKNVPKITGPKEYAVGEKLHIDISLIKITSSGGSKFWLLIVDEKSNCFWSKNLR
jgi:hypothetical protein